MPHGERTVVHDRQGCAVALGPLEPLALIPQPDELRVEHAHTIEDVPSDRHVPTEQSAIATARPGRDALCCETALGTRPQLLARNLEIWPTEAVGFRVISNQAFEDRQVVVHEQFVVVDEDDGVTRRVPHARVAPGVLA